VREKISQLTLNLQNQTIAPLWPFLNDQLIGDVAVGQQYVWQRKSKIIFRGVRIAMLFRSTGMMIFLVGFIKVFKIYHDVKKKQHGKKIQNFCCDHIFMTHGANAEKFIWRDYLSETQGSIAYVNIASSEGLEKFQIPALRYLIFGVLKNTIGLSKKIKIICKNLQIPTMDFLTQAALHIGEYAFFQKFFQQQKKYALKTVTFLALYPAAHACRFAQIKIIYRSHGLIRLSIPMLKPDEMLVIAPEEKIYFESAFHPVFSCRVSSTPAMLAGRLQKSILILPPQSFEPYLSETQNNFNHFLCWAVSQDFKIIVRPSPTMREDSIFALEKLLTCPITLDPPIEDFEKSLSYWRPMFVLGLNSTGLYTALSIGIIPISVCHPILEKHVYSGVYPFAQRAFFWPRDQMLLENILASDPSVYSQVIMRLSHSQEKKIS